MAAYWETAAQSAYDVSPVESGLDLDLGFMENVLMDFDSKQESSECHLGTFGQLSEFNMASKMVDICKGHTV